MIRKAVEGDFLSILHLSEEFWSKTEYDEPFDPSHVLEMVKLSFSHGLLAVVDVDGLVGFIAGISSPLLGNGNVKIAAELAYYVDKEYRGCGLSLLEFYEGLVKDKGIKYGSMMSLQSCDPGKANSLYERMGYHLSEMTYLKVM